MVIKKYIIITKKMVNTNNNNTHNVNYQIIAKKLKITM